MNVKDNTVVIEITSLGESLTRITLSGRLDTPGVDAVETRFVAAVVPPARNVIVDVSQVEFLASMGIRMFVSVARSLRHRQARLAIYGAQPMVGEVFEHVSLREIIPITATEAEAVAAVTP